MLTGQILLKIKPPVDAGLWTFSVIFAALLRVEFETESLEFAGLITVGLSMASLQLLLGFSFGLYRGRYRGDSFEEIALTSSIAAMVSAIAFAAVFLGQGWLGTPRSVPVISGLVFIVLALAFRAIPRILRARPVHSPTARKTLVVGAGARAQRIVPQLLMDTRSQFSPVGLLDDNSDLAKRRIAGTKVLGKIADVEHCIRRTQARVVIVAIATLEGTVLDELKAIASRLSVQVLIAPDINQTLLLGEDVYSPKLQVFESLTGRETRNVSDDEILEMYASKRVLITGAGGSIGSELSKQVSRLGASRVALLDRDESGLQETFLRVSGSGLLDSQDLLLADIRDEKSVNHLFEEFSPDIVLHAAALKHLPLLEARPSEAWKTNVLGTRNVLQASLMAGATHFINISTDKASEPTSVLGKSKRIAEGLTAWASEAGNPGYRSVRFGNVLGSRGSLVPTIQNQIARGLPITLTDRRATRFFMTVSEACYLVLQASLLHGQHGVFVLDMGKPIPISRIADRLLDVSGRNLPIVYSGLRPGEKMHETLAAVPLQPTEHEQIFVTPNEVVDPSELTDLSREFLCPNGVAR